MRIGIDVGGTFTDLVALDEQGALLRYKVPSVPAAPEQGVLAALDALLERIDAGAIAHVSHSTTIATNALLGQQNLELARVVLFTTEGFADVIEIGRQNRSEVYNLFVKRPAPLVARHDRLGVRERMDAWGTPLVPLEPPAIVDALARLGARGDVTSVAVSFLHSYANDAHERALGEALRAAFPDLDVTLSSEVDPAYREYERTSTTVVNAALLPLVRGYVQRLAVALRTRGVNAPLYVMQSNGGMAAAEAAAVRPAAIIESGPASGVIGAASLARELGIRNALSFDMGGTTAKAGTIVDGTPQIATEFEAAGATHSGRAVRGAGYPVRFGFVDLAEVSAGGGTIAFVDEGGALRVGPLSAGADPGPACYGKSQRPTVTDANVVLGRLNPRALLGGAMPIDAQRSRDAVASLLPALDGLSLDEAAGGIITIVDAEMAKIVRIVSIERGHDPREFALIAFGGGGPLHACAVASDLGIERIVVPAAPGLFSAYGLLVADVTTASVQSIVARGGDPQPDAVEALFAAAEERGRRRLADQGVAAGAATCLREIDARYAGQSFELPVVARAPFDAAAKEALIAAFHARHERVYGYASQDEPVELVNVRSTISSALPKTPLQRRPAAAAAQRDAVVGVRDVWFAQTGRVATPVYDRAQLPAGRTFEGPAIVEQYDSSTLLPPDWRLTVDEYENLDLRRC